MDGRLLYNERKNFHYGDRSNDYVVLNIVRGLDFVYVEIGDLMKDYNQTLLFAAIVRIGGGNRAIWISRGWKDFSPSSTRKIMQTSKLKRSKLI